MRDRLCVRAAARNMCLARGQEEAAWGLGNCRRVDKQNLRQGFEEVVPKLARVLVVRAELQFKCLPWDRRRPFQIAHAVGEPHVHVE